MSKQIYTTLSLCWSDYVEAEGDWNEATEEGIEVLTARFVEHLQTILSEGRASDYIIVETDDFDIMEDEA